MWQVQRALATLFRLQPGYELPSSGYELPSSAGTKTEGPAKVNGAVKVVVDPEAVANVDLSPVLGATPAPVLTRRSCHPGVNPGANFNSIPHKCHLFEVALVWDLTQETICLPLGCLQGGMKLRARLHSFCCLGVGYEV